MMKSQVTLDQVTVAYGSHQVLEATSLTIKAGEFLTILGPSGSGKTTILKLLGGFLKPSSGKIVFDDTDITALPPEKRPFNTVFQDYALFPNMTVGDNVGYSLRLKGIQRDARAAEAEKALKLVGLEGFARRRVSQLSGGQQQRVALARAIVAKPSVILLDEPLSALDAGLRHQMQLFLKSIQRKLGTTFVFVTHDQQEALSMSDRIVVMNFGHIVQIGSPADIYNVPASSFVATFIGRNNLIQGRYEVTGGFFDTPIGRIRSTSPMISRPENEIRLAVRPEAIVVTPRAAALTDNDLNLATGRVEDVIFVGSHLSYQVRVGDMVLLECTTPVEAGEPMPIGAEVDLHFRPENVRVVGDA